LSAGRTGEAPGRGFSLTSTGVHGTNCLMLGFADVWIFVGYVFTLLSALFCVLYGVVNWRKGVEEKDGDYREEIRWEKEEIELIEKLP
jgi:hypothetical protein